MHFFQCKYLVLNLVFSCFMYSLCRSPHRCIKHLVLDSGDSSEVPGTLANDVFKFVLKSYYLPAIKTRISNLYFLSILVLFSPSLIFKKYGVLVLISCFLKSAGATGISLRQRTLGLSIFSCVLLNNAF